MADFLCETILFNVLSILCVKIHITILKILFLSGNYYYVQFLCKRNFHTLF